MTVASTTAPGTRPATPATRLEASGLAVAYAGRRVVHDVDLVVEPGMITTLIGPNGCGKSTLLKALARVVRPSSGEVLLDGRRIDSVPTRRVATKVSLLPQSPVAPPGLTVAELVARGLHPRQRWYQQLTVADERAVADAMAWTGVAELAGRPLDDLSGGQRQRAWIAMVLAQATDVILLDEPTTYLDLTHQLEVLSLISRLNRELGRTALMVLHDISLAARFSDRLIAMRDGRVVAQGEPHEVVTEAGLRDVFGLDAAVIADPGSGRPHVIPR